VKIATVSMVKARVEDLGVFVDYHLGLGIDLVILFFDDPDDPAAEHFSSTPNVKTIRCDAGYWRASGGRSDVFEDRLRLNFDEGLRMARGYGCEWGAPIDSDELIRPLGDIKAILRASKADVLRFELLEALTERRHYSNIFEPRLFKKVSRHPRLWLARMLSCRRAFYRGEYIRGHTASKVFIRMSDKIGKMTSSHGPQRRPGVVEERTRRIQLLHFDCVGLENWRNKWENRAHPANVATEMRTNRIQQFQDYLRARDEGEQAVTALYDRVQTIPEREKVILSSLGMLTRIDLPF
jgi:hypothetical protein